MKKIIELTKELIAIRSETDSHQEGCKQCYECLQKELSVHGEIIEHNGVYSFVVKNFDGKYADVVLNGHVDVVPANDDQRAAIEKDGRLYGRGTGDMKAGIALITILFEKFYKKIKEEGSEAKVMLLLTGDEEIGGFNGAGYLASEGYGGNVILIPDGGSTNSVVVASKGVVNIALVGKGKSAHASRPRLGSSLHDDLMGIMKKFNELVVSGSKEKPWGPTATITQLSMGHVSNAIAKSLEATVDIRFTEGWSVESIIKTIEKILENYEEFTLGVNVTGEMIWSDHENNPVIEQYLLCVNDVVGEVETVKECGSSDGRWFAGEGSTVILHRPTCKNIHAANEWVSIEGIEKIYAVYEKFLNNFLYLT